MTSLQLLTLSLAGLVVANWNVSVAGTPCACAKLGSSYPDKLLFPSSANYTVEATSYWDIRDDLHPSCIFLPTTTIEVANAVKILTHCDAHFAVRGGGHMNVRSLSLPSKSFTDMDSFPEPTISTTASSSPCPEWTNSPSTMRPSTSDQA
jgi:hypothetical protein